MSSNIQFDPSYGTAALAAMSEDEEKALMSHFLYKDHAVIRRRWRNFDTVLPGIFRSSQPSPEQLEDYKAKGFKTILNLRGPQKGESFYIYESEACERLDLGVKSFNIRHQNLPAKEMLQEIFAFVEAAETPLLFHCKSGADRTGFIAALLLLKNDPDDFATARRHLSMRYVHAKSRVMASYDFVVDRFEIARKATGVDLMTWIDQTYDANALLAQYNKKIGRRRWPFI